MCIGRRIPFKWLGWDYPDEGYCSIGERKSRTILSVFVYGVKIQTSCVRQCLRHAESFACSFSLASFPSTLFSHPCNFRHFDKPSIGSERKAPGCPRFSRLRWSSPYPLIQITGRIFATLWAKCACSAASTTAVTSLYAPGASSATPRSEAPRMRIP